MWRRGLVALLGLAALAACEPANDAQRLALHWQACQAQTGLIPQRATACTQVIDAPGVTLAQRVLALVARGELRASNNEDERAFSDFGQALRFDPREADAYIQRGLLHQKHGAYDAAIADFDAADRIDDDSAGADYRQDAIAAEVGAYRSQIQLLTNRIAANGKDPSLYNNRCWLRAIVGDDLTGALADCNAALRLAPNTAEYLDSRGLVELKLRDYPAAFSDYNAATTGDSDDGAHFLYGRGLARIGLNAMADAMADLQAAREMRPGIDGAYESYGIAPLTGALAKD